MRKIVVLLSIVISFTIGCGQCYGQGMNIWARDGTPQYIYVGSLMKDKNSGQNKEKIKVEIFGGDYGSSELATTTYGIGTRFNYNINKDVQGGGNANSKHRLRVYDNGNQFDFVIETIGWTAIIVKAWILDIDPVAHEVKCTGYNPTGKSDVSNQFITTIFMCSSTNGNIGIGTSTPQSKLDVRGKIIADEVQIKVNIGADFVFQPDYNLKPLSEVEQFVKTNKHLPEIPSERQMIEDGVNVNDMQIKLLQKIEELTLYMIEQDKKIERLQEQLNNK